MRHTPSHGHGPLSGDKDVLKATLEDLQRENERLRSARASVTSQLGPLPVSAALVAGLIGGFTASGGGYVNDWLLGFALLPFALMVFISILYGGIRPYRKLRDRAERQLRPRAGATIEQYYRDAIRVEEEVRGSSLDERGNIIATYRVVWPWRAETLQQAFDAEWQGLFVTKILFVCVIVLLILARIV